MKARYMVLVFLFFFAAFPVTRGKALTCAASPEQLNEFRGIWVSTVYAMDYPVSYVQDSAVLKKRIDDIVDCAKSYGFNAVIFQARPAADAFYNSSIFPWSKYLTGTQGKAPDNGFDPLLYIIEKCHDNDIELHAWINPYRVTALPSDKLVQNHIALQDEEFTVCYNGKLYFNPGVPGVRNIILEGVREIILNYKVDGIHYDDYFYPGIDFNDNQTYLKYNTKFNNIGDWRRNNNDLLIEKTRDFIKSVNADISFGVSPPGIWANKTSNALGSLTSGFEAYNDIFADSRKWAVNNWVDYIAPQVYWHIGNPAANYYEIVNWWAHTVKGTDTLLYIGMAGYKSEDLSFGAVWQGGEEIERQILLNRNTAGVSGMMVFKMQDILTKPALQQQILKYFIFDDLMPNMPNDEIIKTIDPERAENTNPQIIQHADDESRAADKNTVKALQGSDYNKNKLFYVLTSIGFVFAIIVFFYANKKIFKF